MAARNFPKAALAFFVLHVAFATADEVIKNGLSADQVLSESLPVSNKSAASRHLLLLADTGTVCYTGSSCVSSSYQCASGYNCYLVTDGSCTPSGGCSTCTASSSYYGCYTSQPGTTVVTYQLDSISGLRCYQSATACNSVVSNTCTGSGTSCTSGASTYCSQTGASYNYYCPNSVTSGTPSAQNSGGTSTSTCVPGSTLSSGCNGCTSCSAAQSCANSACRGSASNFQCTTLNGVGSWTASCPSTSAAVDIKSAAGIIAATAAAMLI